MEPASEAAKALAKKNSAAAGRQMLLRSLPPALLMWAFISASHYMSPVEIEIAYAALWGFMCGVLIALGHPGAKYQARDGGSRELRTWQSWLLIAVGVGAFVLGAKAYVRVPWLIVFELAGAFGGWFWFDWFRHGAQRGSSMPVELH